MALMFRDGDVADALRRRLPKSACISISNRRDAGSNAPDPKGREIVMQVMFVFVLIILLLVGALSWE